MNSNQPKTSKNLLMAAASLLSVAGAGVLIGLPAAAQSQLNPNPSIFNEAPFNGSNRVLAPNSPGQPPQARQMVANG